MLDFGPFDDISRNETFNYRCFKYWYQFCCGETFSFRSLLRTCNSVKDTWLDAASQNSYDWYSLVLSPVLSNVVLIVRFFKGRNIAASKTNRPRKSTIRFSSVLIQMPTAALLLPSLKYWSNPSNHVDTANVCHTMLENLRVHLVL